MAQNQKIKTKTFKPEASVWVYYILPKHYKVNTFFLKTDKLITPHHTKNDRFVNLKFRVFFSMVWGDFILSRSEFVS